MSLKTQCRRNHVLRMLFASAALYLLANILLRHNRRICVEKTFRMKSTMFAEANSLLLAEKGGGA